MLKNNNIICISSIDWDFVWQGHQEIMNTYAQSGNRVLFIENTGIRTPHISDLPRIKKRLINWFRSFSGIRQEKDNLFIYSPVIIPFPYSKIASVINRWIMMRVLRNWMKAANFTDPIIWTFLPTRTSIDLIKTIENKLSVYYCIADFDELVKDTRKLRKSEKELLKTVDLVFAQGKFLMERCSKFNNHVSVFPFGVKRGIFESFKDKTSREVPKDLEDIPGKKIGYIGGIHKHISYDTIEYLARKKPDWSIVLIGPDQIDYSNRAKPENIIMLGMKKHHELPNYINNIDVCLIPYEISSYTDTVYPTKLNEYLFMGKPVVSTALPEVKEFNRLYGNVVRVAESRESFLDLVENSLKEDDVNEISKRKEVAMDNTWEKRIENMSVLIEKRIVEKTESCERSWKENFINIYHTSKKRVLTLTVTIALLYSIIFYSPLIWFMASPLRIDQNPQKADAIVVFGGGVGETGSPGKSTIERSRFSAELYKQGYADKIIFSSGYKYYYNDAENMKLIALSVNIPEEDIMLEKKANSCYENVIYSTRLLRDNNYKKILIVTSPYNMRRAQLIYKKTAADIEVVYVAVPNPEFYFRKTKVGLEQIKAILHECAGILYYYFKGYI